MKYTLRDYQLAATKTTMAFLKYKKRNGLVVMPTGSGKSLVIADLVKTVRKQWKVKILILSHIKEIIGQDYNKLAALLPNEKIGVYSASLHQREVRDITIGSVQTVVNALDKFDGVRLVIIDEAHLVPEDDKGSYNKIINALTNVVVLGYTATPYRYNGPMVKLDHIFTDIIYDVKVSTLINKGYLSRVFTKNTKIKIDTSKLKIVAGDYSKKSLRNEIDRFGLTKSICDNMLQFKNERKHWLLFCVSIEHAKHVAEYLTSIGVLTMAVHSNMDSWERDLVIKLHKEGKLQAIAQVNILSVGYDFPEIDLIGALRPTKSHVLHRQMVGRGLRIADGKKDCLVLDYAGNFGRLGPIDIEPDFKPKGKKAGVGQAPTKTCPECDEEVLLSAKVCPDCGYEFPVNEKLTPYAKEAAVLASDLKPKINKYTVNGVFYAKIQKGSNPPVLKVTYKLPGLKRISEWVGLESDNFFLKEQADRWWRKRDPERRQAITVEQALQHTKQLTIPRFIEVDESGKYPKIKKYFFSVNEAS